MTNPIINIQHDLLKTQQEIHDSLPNVPASLVDKLNYLAQAKFYLDDEALGPDFQKFLDSTIPVLAQELQNDPTSTTAYNLAVLSGLSMY